MKTILKYSFKLIFTVVVFAVILYGFQKKLGDQQNLLEQIQFHFHHLNGWIYAGAGVLFFASTFILAFRLLLLTRSYGIEIGYWALFKNIYIGLLFNPLLMGSTGGDVLRSYYLTRQTGKKTQVVTMVFLDRLIGIYSIVLLCLVALLFNVSDPRFRSIFWGAAFLLAGLMFVTVLFFSRRIYQRFSFLKKWVRHSKLREIIKTIFHTLHGVRNNPKPVVLALLCTFLLQAFAISGCWVTSLAFTEIPSISLKYFFLFIPVIMTISSVPISLGGVGVGEAAFAALFSFVGVKEADSISIALGYRSIIILQAIVGGIVYLLPADEKISLKEVPSP